MVDLTACWSGDLLVSTTVDNLAGTVNDTFDLLVRSIVMYKLAQLFYICLFINV